VVAGVETRKVGVDRKLSLKNYGVLDCGVELMRFTWPGLLCVTRTRSGVSRGDVHRPDGDYGRAA